MDTSESQSKLTTGAATSKETSPHKDQDNSRSGMFV